MNQDSLPPRTITVGALGDDVWDAIKAKCVGQVASMLELLQGQLSDQAMTVVTDRDTGLFPKPREIALKCSCPDSAKMCKLSVYIGEFDGLGLILEYPSGGHYCSQTGGYACHHPKVEGAFIPLDETGGMGSVLEDHFTSEKWGGHCYSGIDEETADFVDDVLSRTSGSKRIKVDRSRLTECEEAWVYVIVQADECEFYPSWSMGGLGVLTWNNSD